MARNLVTQTLNILQGGVKEAGKDYFANMTSFYNDAKNVRNTLINTSTDASDTFARLKKANITKAISDWFYQEESTSEMEINGNTDEFDAGFEISGSGDKKRDGDTAKPSGLTVDAMMNISNKQTNAILKVGRRQNEQSVANTAEIISTIDTRSSEMITSLNNINKTLLGISSRLDKIIELQAVPLTNQKEIDKGGLYQDGNLSLMRIFEASKQNVLTTGPMSLLTTGLDMLRSGHLTPTALAGIGIKGIAGKIKINGKSFDDWGNAFNEMVGTATQTAMNEMINSNFFQKYIGKITSFDADKDYSTVIPDHYDTKRAVFDGMTRQSIVNLIPQMLSKINESLSGQAYSIDGRGRWVAGPQKNEFNAVTRASFSNSGLGSNAITSISNAGVQSIGKKIPTADIEKASKALTMAIVMYQHEHGDRAFTISQLRGDLTNQVVQACEVLTMTGGDPKYWAKVCNSIILQLSSGMMDAASFVRNINDSVQRMIRDAVEFAQTGKANATQAGKLSFNIAANQFLEQYAPKAETAKIAESQNKGTLVDGKNIRVDESNKVGKFSVNQYIGGIFYLLNRGINVRIDKSGEKYEGLNLADVKPDSVPYVSDDTFGKMVKGVLTGEKDAVKEAVREELGVAKKEKGFFGKILENPAMLFNSLSHLFAGGSINFQGMKDKARGLLGDDRYNALADKAGNIKDRIVNDDRYIAAKLAAQETVEKLKGKGEELYDKFGHTRIGNNMMYAKDSLKLKAAEDTISHMTIDDELDQEAAAITKYYTSRGMLDEAASAAAGIKNKNVRTAFVNFVNVHKKRLAGQQALAEGQTPDIGSILIEKDIKAGKDNKTGTTNSILFKILGAIGKIGKFVAKMAESGLRNIYFGLKSVGGALFGYEDFDNIRGVKYKNKGLLRNMTTELIASSYRSAKWLAKGISSVARNKFGDPNDNRSMRERYEDFLDVRAGVKTQNIVDEQGNVIDFDDKQWDWLARNRDKAAVNTYTRGASFVDGKLQKGGLQQETAMTTLDALKHPLEAVTKSLGNFGQNLKFVGETAVEGAKTVFGKIQTFFKDLRGNVGKIWEGVKRTKIGGALFNNKFTRGFASGFNEARAAKQRQLEKKKLAQDKAEHPLQGMMVDFMKSPDAPDLSTATKKSSVLHKAFDRFFTAKDSFYNIVKEWVDHLRQKEEDEKDEEDNREIDGEDDEKKEKKKGEDGSEATDIDDSQGERERIEASQNEARESVRAASEGTTIRPTASSTDDTGGWSTDTTAASSMINIGNTTQSTNAATIMTPPAGDDITTVSGGGILNNIGNTLGSIGKMFGGFMQIFGGVAQLIVSIVTTMEGFGALTDLVKSILVDGLEPINEIFYSIIDMIKPVTKMLTEYVGYIAETVVEIAGAILESIQPLLDAIQPLIEGIFAILKPILQVITVTLEIILMPIKLVLEMLQPVFEGIGYRMQMIGGALQWLLGTTMQGFAGVLMGLGWLVEKIGSFLGSEKMSDGGEHLTTIGENLYEKSQGMKEQGAADFQEGLEGVIGQWKDLFGLSGDDSKAKEAIAEAYGTPAKLGSDFGAGDVSTTNITNNNWSYTYGSGNPMDQHSYGSYMNMSERGCGPIALADAFGRRSGGSVNPGELAMVMTGAGAYNPARGTSVNSMLAVGNAMGMGMRAGGVTAASLSRASSSSPITLLGSGTGFGTRSGNDHYVNVIGSDASGSAYVSNPLTGRVEKHAMSNLVRNSKLGLYGSGDSDDTLKEEYGFSEAATESLNRLKEITARITGMFQGEDEGTRKKREENNKKTASKIKSILSKEDYDIIFGTALTDLKEKYPKDDEESDEEYETRMNELMSGAEGNALIVKYGKEKGITALDDYVSAQEKAFADMSEGLDSMKSSISASVKALIESRNMSSDAPTGAEMALFEPVLHIKPEFKKNDSGKYIESPVHDFFNATSVEGKMGANRSGGAKGTVYSSSQGGWFEKFKGPQTEEGVGTSGDTHEGILLRYSNDSGTGNALARAITGGTVTYVTKDKEGAKNGLGNAVKWRDSGGMYHWYMHMASIDKDIQEGSNLEPGQLIGYFGRSGLDETDSNGNKLPNVLRYVVTSAGPQGSTGDPGYINPFTYWQFREEADLTSGDTEEQTYKYLVSKGMSPVGAAGMMGCFKHESNFQYDNLENVYQAKMGYPAGQTGDAQYAADVDSKKESRQNFITGRNLTHYGGQTPGEAVGFGIAQFTSSNLKTSLYDNTVARGKSITDIPGQLDEVINVLKARGLYDQIKNSGTPTDANKLFLWKYEAGTGYTSDAQVLSAYPWMKDSNPDGVTARHLAAEEYYKKYKGINVGSSANAQSNDKGAYNGRFIGSSTNPAAFGNEGIIQSAAEVFSAWNGGNYMQGDSGTLKLANGSSIPHFRPDCSGSLSGVIRNMGYDINMQDQTGFRTYDLIGKTSNDMIYKNGQPSSDWKFIPYSQGSLKEGDIIVAKEHMGMYVTGDDNSSWGNKGFDGGSTDGFSRSARGANAYLSGDADWKSKLTPTLSGADTGDDKLQTIVRYVGAAGKSTGGNTDRGGLSYGYHITSDGKKTMKAISEAGSMADYIKSLNGSGDISVADIPSIDVNKLMGDSSNTGFNALQQYVNKYNIRTDDSHTTDMLDKLSSMTFNVRAKRVEELLEILIAKVDGNGAASDAPLPELFNEGIPEAVTRLSMG